MNKYVLILPLVILSVFLGYFASSSKMEQVYAIAAVTTVLVATSGYLLFLKHQKVGDSKRIRKTKVATAFIAVLLFSTLIGVQLVNLVAANPMGFNGGEKPPDADTKPPKISIASPENNTIHNTYTIVLSFNVSVGESTTASFTWIDELSYMGDWQEHRTYINLEEIYYDEPYVGLEELSSKLPPMFSFNITDIPKGKHSITVYATEKGRYVSSPVYWNFYINASASVNFGIDAVSPAVTVLSVENRTYGTSDVPLNFTVNEQTEWIGYSLDGQANITITANMTLTELPAGSHNLTVYAKDAAGNIGASETVHFSIDQKPKLVILGSTLPMEYGYALAAVIVMIIVAMAGYLFVKRKKLGEGT